MKKKINKINIARDELLRAVYKAIERVEKTYKVKVRFNYEIKEVRK